MGPQKANTIHLQLRNSKGGVAKGHSWQANTACGSGLARERIAAVLQLHRSAVIASKPVPT
ncbi:hypothetical protein EQV96_11940 [Pseudomonas sp. TMW22080]|nr:hypothetical protein [Pseudomonas sp. TMW22080]